jgi:hypothetical protein
MSQAAADQLAQVLKNLLASRASEQSQLATNKQLLASAKAELAAETLKVDQATQSLLAYKAKLTDPVQRAAIDQSIAAIDRSKITSLNRSISSFEEFIAQNNTQLSEIQKSITATQNEINKEKSSEGQTGPVPTDNPTATSNNTTTATIASPAATNAYVTETTTSPFEPVTISVPQAIDTTIGPNAGLLATTTNNLSVGSILGNKPKYSTQGLLAKARVDMTKAVQINQAMLQADWRVRLSLAKGAEYLYNAPQDPNTGASAGILAPLKTTSGVIFPYTPAIQVQYAASYPDQRLIHTNYKIFQYQGSSVDQVTISCDFTAQDTSEADYMLAVIHFFRSLTKMFYGQDSKPNPGTPPPMCFLSGLGEFQFNNHPLVVSAFTYDLPTDVDYIRASSSTTLAGVSKSAEQGPKGPSNASSNRKQTNRVPPGGVGSAPVWEKPANSLINSPPTYVPTKMKMLITCIPIVTRNDISTKFSLRAYATGALIKRGLW